jgi:hypothetical protein
MHGIPTPESDEVWNEYLKSNYYTEDVEKLRKLHRDLERRLVVARVALDTLARLGNEPYFGNSEGNIIAHHALELTAPKS